MVARGVVILTVFGAISAAVALPAEKEATSSLETIEFMQEIKSECQNKTGDDRAFQDLVAVLNQDTPRCFMKHVNLSYLQAPLPVLDQTGQGKILEEICGQIEKALVCVNPVVEKVKPCMNDEDDLKILQRIVDTVPDALKMICNNSGAMLFKLKEPLARSCAIELAPAIDICMDVISNSTMNTDLSEYTITECNEIYKMRDCLVHRISDCGAVTYLELFNLFYRNLLGLTPCK